MVADRPIARSRLSPPRLPREALPRLPLRDRLTRSDAALTVVVAPPGFGKSGLLAAWVADLPHPAAWATLEERDNRLEELATLLAMAVNRVVPETVASPLRYLDASRERADAATVATHFLNDLADLTNDLVLVVDDAHLVTDPAAVQFLRLLATTPLPGFRLVLSGRENPSWPLAGLRASGNLLELRGPDLRLTAAEVAEHAARLAHRPLAPDETQALWDLSQGWLTAVRFLGASAAVEHGDWKADAPTTADEATRERMTWLLNQVVASYPPTLRAFLLRLAVPERVNRALAERLADGLCAPTEARALYDRVLEDGLFLSRPDEEGWSVVHAHVRRAMATELQESEGAGRVAALHAVAAEWFRGAGLWDEAIVHAEASGGPTAAAAMIRAAVQPMLGSERWRALERWIATLPQPVFRRDPALMVAAGWCAWVREDYVQARNIAEVAGRLLDGQPDLSPAEMAGLRAEVTALTAGVNFIFGEPARAAALATEATAALGPDRPYALGTSHSIRALARFLVNPKAAIRETEQFLAGSSLLEPSIVARVWGALAVIVYQSGDMRRTRQLADRTRTLAEQARSAHTGGWADALVALSAYQTNELETTIERASAVLQQTGGVHVAAAREALICLALAYEGTHRPDDADLTIARLEEFLIEEGTMRGLREAASLRALFDLRRGNHAAARVWLEETEMADDAPPSHSSVDARVVQMEIAVTLGIDPEGSPQRIARFLEAGTGYDTLQRHVELTILLAAARHRRGDTAGARQALEDALRLGMPTGNDRAFIDFGDLVAPMLPMIEPGSRFGHDAARLRVLIDRDDASRGRARPTTTARPDAPLPDSDDVAERRLSDRELEVLHLIGQRLTNKEIAERLRISPLTVKRHSTNIYAKLGASTRRQAVAVAEQLGLAPDTGQDRAP